MDNVGTLAAFLGFEVETLAFCSAVLSFGSSFKSTAFKGLGMESFDCPMENHPRRAYCLTC